ncbi:MAG: phosphatidate cytidylyltransferase [Firmicutes bacterium]|nr:phosphatidate cytidylyltransferase [Bacillota bacterium]
MLVQRIITAIVGIPVIIAGLYFGGVFWKLVVFFLVLGGLWEFSTMGESPVYPDFLLAFGLSFLLLTYSGNIGKGNIFLIWLVLQIFYYLLRATFHGLCNFSAAFNLLGVFYVAVPLSFLWSVRAQFGFAWALFGFLVTWATDTGAFFGGRRLGKKQLAPRISPNKSVEGAGFGLFAALIVGIIFAYLTKKSTLLVGGLAILLSVFGQVGDLVESAFKRERALKDSGSLLPGHGGILDRFDSLGFVFPLLYILLSLLTRVGFS